MFSLFLFQIMRLVYSFSLLLFLTIVLLQYTTTIASPIPTATATATIDIIKRGPPDDVSGKWNHPHGCPEKRDLVARGGGDEDDDQDCPTTTTTSTHSSSPTATSAPNHGHPPSDDPSNLECHHRHCNIYSHTIHL